jgi:uncharacterized protein
MNFFTEKKNIILIVIAIVVLVFFFAPIEQLPLEGALQEALLLLSEYVQEHVLLCLVPAFFIAGAIMEFFDQQAVLRFLGPKAPKPISYLVAAVSGSVLAVCSCTVLPLFKGIYRKGAGIGPATAFLYSGPAINVVAIILTAKVLGPRLGIARAVSAVLFAFVLAALMHLFFLRSDRERKTDPDMFAYDAGEKGVISRNILLMTSLIGFLVFVNWPSIGGSKLSRLVYDWRIAVSLLFILLLVYTLRRNYKKSEMKTWREATKDFAVQMLPLLFAGVLIAGFLLGRPGESGLIPEEWIVGLVGGNSWSANFAASLIGALMYFATLTEIPILQGLLGSGMGEGPALALLLAGPSISLPSLLLIGEELGLKKTAVYVLLVVGLSTLVGITYGAVFT